MTIDPRQFVEELQARFQNDPELAAACRKLGAVGRWPTRELVVSRVLCRGDDSTENWTPEKAHTVFDRLVELGVLEENGGRAHIVDLAFPALLHLLQKLSPTATKRTNRRASIALAESVPAPSAPASGASEEAPLPAATEAAPPEPHASAVDATPPRPAGAARRMACPSSRVGAAAQETVARAAFLCYTNVGRTPVERVVYALAWLMESLPDFVFPLSGRMLAKLVAAMIAETGGECPKTYAMMRELRTGDWVADPCDADQYYPGPRWPRV